MPIYKVSLSADDGSIGAGGDTSGDFIQVLDNRILDVAAEGFAIIDTSGIDTDKIISARAYWYTDLYSKSKGIPYSKIVSCNYREIFNEYSDSDAGLGWNYVDISKEDFQYIDAYGDTVLRFNVQAPGAGNYRIWKIRSFDYGDDAEFSPYLEIKHSEFGARTVRSVVRI